MLMEVLVLSVGRFRHRLGADEVGRRMSSGMGGYGRKEEGRKKTGEISL